MQKILIDQQMNLWWWAILGVPKDQLVYHLIPSLMPLLQQVSLAKGKEIVVGIPMDYEDMDAALA